MSAFPTIKLTYFPIAARAEPIRLAFHVGNVPFIDERINGEQLAALKPTLPFGQLPVLTIDGHVVAQSQALLRYAGRLANLYPANDALAGLKIDEVLAGLDEVFDAYGPTVREQDAEKKKTMRLELANATFPRLLSQIDARLAKMKELYPVFQSDAIFIHDIAIANLYKFLSAGFIDHVPTTIVDGHAHIKASSDRVLAHPKVKEWYSMQHSAPKLKLTYFPAAGRAEATRLALHIGGIAFEDERITGDEFAARKATLPYGQLPVLEVNGDVIAQSTQILRYAGTLSGLYPTNDAYRALLIDELLATFDDMLNSFAASRAEKDPEKIVALRKVLAEETLPKYFANIDKRIGDEHPFAVGSQLSVADLAVFAVDAMLKSGRIDHIPTTLLEPYKNIVRVAAQVKAHPKVVEWYETHQQ